MIALATSLPQFTERGRQAALDAQVQQIEKFTGQPMSDEQYARMQTFMKYGGLCRACRDLHSHADHRAGLSPESTS